MKINTKINAAFSRGHICFLQMGPLEQPEMNGTARPQGENICKGLYVFSIDLSHQKKRKNSGLVRACSEPHCTPPAKSRQMIQQ